MTWSDPTPHRTPPRSKTGPTAGDRPPTVDPFPDRAPLDRAPLDHVPVHPTVDPRLPTAARLLLASIALLGGALLGRCWPW